jgi:hypothetical protein
MPTRSRPCVIGCSDAKPAYLSCPLLISNFDACKVLAVLSTVSGPRHFSGSSSAFICATHSLVPANRRNRWTKTSKVNFQFRTMADVSERRIRPIQDAVESKNWKQALQLCEKWQKKGERSDRFQVLRIKPFMQSTDNDVFRQ